MTQKTTKENNYRHWMATLTPIYGEREANNMWRWYEEAQHPLDLFEHDLALLVDDYPIQYLTGYGYFYGEKYSVNKETLIPRPETEELVYHILENYPKNEKLKVIDLGTGTGCIAITLKKHRPDWEVSGMDLYPQTLDVARKNSLHHKVNINWIEGDILTLPLSHSDTYDIIVSNPPYISLTEKESLGKNVLSHEPHQALFTQDEKGLEFYKAIAIYGLNALSSGAEIYLEIHEDNSKSIANLFDAHDSYSTPDIIRDMQGKDRILRVKRQSIKQ